MSEPRRKKRGATGRGAGRRGAEPQPRESLDVDQRDERDVAETYDPDGRIAPDHQRDARTEGRPPEQAVVERAREQNPPINRDDRADDDIPPEK